MSMHEKFPRSLPHQSNKQPANECWRQQKPWTEEEYERVRLAAIILVKTVEFGYEQGRPSVDGRALWVLFGAVDRTGKHAVTD